MVKIRLAIAIICVFVGHVAAQDGRSARAPYVDDFGASGSVLTTKASIEAGSTTLTLASPLDFADGQGIAIDHAGAPSGLRPPTGVTAMAQEGTGTHRIAYAIASVDADCGLSAVSTVGRIANAPDLQKYQNPMTATPFTVAITGAAASPEGRIRLTVPSTAHLLRSTRLALTSVSGVEGTTEANGSFVNLRIVDRTHVDLEPSMFVHPYKRGGAIVYYPTVEVRFARPRVGRQVSRFAIYASRDDAPFALAGETNGEFWYDYGTPHAAESCLPAMPPDREIPDDLFTTILSGGGTNALRLAEPAKSTVHGTGVNHDDTSAFVAAAKSLHGHGGPLHLSPGKRYPLPSGFTLPPGVELIGTTLPGVIGGGNYSMPYDTMGALLVSKDKPLLMAGGSGLSKLAVLPFGTTFPITNPNSFVGTGIATAHPDTNVLPPTGPGTDTHVSHVMAIGWNTGYSQKHVADNVSDRTHIDTFLVDALNGMDVYNAFDWASYTRISLFPFASLAYHNLTPARTIGGPGPALPLITRRGTGMIVEGQQDNANFDEIEELGHDVGFHITTAGNIKWGSSWADNNADTAYVLASISASAGGHMHAVTNRIGMFVGANSMWAAHDVQALACTVTCIELADNALFQLGTGFINLAGLSAVAYDSPRARLQTASLAVVSVKGPAPFHLRLAGTPPEFIPHAPQLTLFARAMPSGTAYAGHLPRVTQVASAPLVRLDPNKRQFEITGTARISKFAGLAPGDRFDVDFTDVLVLDTGTPGSNLVLPGTRTITTKGGTSATFLVENDMRYHLIAMSAP